VLASGIRSIGWQPDLAHFKQRLQALEVKVAEEGIVLAEAQERSNSMTMKPRAK